jgi:hypothetical protein
MKKLGTLLLFGLLAHIVWSIGAFIGYSFTGDKPTLSGTMIAGLVILPASYVLGMLYRRYKAFSALSYALFSTMMTFGLNLLISIPNQTTTTFFGNWFVYLTFLAVFAGGFFAVSQNKGLKAL